MLMRILKPVVLVGALLALSGCYVAPPPPAPVYGYYAAPGYYYGPPVVGSVDVGVGGYWGRRYWR
jgi:hypothetical protein